MAYSKPYINWIINIPLYNLHKQVPFSVQLPKTKKPQRNNIHQLDAFPLVCLDRPKSLVKGEEDKGQ